MDDELKEPLDRLSKELETLNAHRFIRVNNSVWRMILFQFARGLAFGLGSVLGASILVSILVWWLSQFEFIPIVGDFAQQLIQWIENASQTGMGR